MEAHKLPEKDEVHPEGPEDEADDSSVASGTDAPKRKLRKRPPRGAHLHKPNATVLLQKPLREHPDKLHGWEFYRQALRGAKHVVAPMVDCSLLPWRLLCRRYGAHLAYTPMLHAKRFGESAVYRSVFFSTCPEDRPLIAQFCANDPALLLEAARFVDGECEAVDLNMGCPQNIAKRGNYGAFLMDGDWDLVYRMVNTLHRCLGIPVTCKIRLLPSLEKTIEFAKMLQAAGCSLLTVHGRTKEQKGHRQGYEDLYKVRAVREALDIPVVANGNVRSFEDVASNLQRTGAVGIMSAEGILRNPALFSGLEPQPLSLALEYIELSKRYPQELRFLKGHVQKLVLHDLDNYFDLKMAISGAKHEEDLLDILKELSRRKEAGVPFNLQPPHEKNCTVVDLSDTNFDSLGLQ
jgi:tRNA-dihydrouridine synthase 1